MPIRIAPLPHLYAAAAVHPSWSVACMPGTAPVGTLIFGARHLGTRSDSRKRRSIALDSSIPNNTCLRDMQRHWSLVSPSNVTLGRRTLITHGKSTAPPSDPVEPPSDWLLFHPVYTPQQLDAVKVVNREPKTFSDKIASLMVVVVRSIFDMATRYPKHRDRFPLVKGRAAGKVRLPSASKVEQSIDALDQTSGPTSSSVSSSKAEVSLKPMPTEKATAAQSAEPEFEMELQEMRQKGLTFGPNQWLVRILFLESIAGVPGMAAAVCRHLHSIRLLRRDNGGWIRTCLEDAENERMHLLTFLKLAEPGIFMRAMLLAAQGVFFNFFFVFYLVSPKTAHRFVGKLEEEAVYTYSAILEDIKEGRIPEWEDYPAPQIAIDYWRLAPNANLTDVLKAVRLDEATHRFINHTFASLDQKKDYSPFSHGEVAPELRGSTYGFEREESLRYMSEQREQVQKALAQARERKSGHTSGASGAAA